MVQFLWWASSCVNEHHMAHHDNLLHQESTRIMSNTTVSRPIPIETLRTRFWERVITGITPDDCWSWFGGTLKGYPQIWYKGTTYQIHRLSYLLHVGDLKGLQVLHTCDNKRCSNPKHLYLGTHQDNMQDLAERNPNSSGEKHYLATITSEQIKDIIWKSNCGYSASMIAEEYKVTRSCIHKILQGKNRKRG